jgi:HNH endonuclease
MNPKKFRGWCTNGCGRTINANAIKFCSVACQHEFSFETRSRLLEAGGYSVLQANKFLRKYLIRQFGEQCSRCGWAERHSVTKKVPIEVEHIDGNWRNNRLDNVTLLCPNCHALTPTFRGLNRGRGRPHRVGGRENPIKVQEAAVRPARKTIPQQVFEPPAMQLQLLQIMTPT